MHRLFAQAYFYSEIQDISDSFVAQPFSEHFNSGAPTRAKRAWDRAPYPWNMVNLFAFGCHVIDRTYVRTYVRTRLQIVWMG